MAPSLRAREIGVGDGPFIAKLMRQITPLHVDVFETIELRLERLLDEAAAIGAIVEQFDQKSGLRKIVGTTLLAFVHDSFVANHFASPQPLLTSTLLRSVENGSIGHFMSKKDQAKANLGTGMEQVILEFAVDPMDLQHPDFAPVMNELYSAYFRFERGYNIKGVFVEAGSTLEPLVIGSGLFHHSYHELTGTNQEIIVPTRTGTHRGLYRITRQEKSKLPPSSAAFVIMTYIAPAFQFTPTEQRLLSLAIEGLTDTEIAAILKVSRDALKQTWRGIYDHATDVMPGLFDVSSESTLVGGRGTEKRRHIVSHVRDNLQELRPHHLRRG
jgi:hypothetical protein